MIDEGRRKHRKRLHCRHLHRGCKMYGPPLCRSGGDSRRAVRDGLSENIETNVKPSAVEEGRPTFDRIFH